MNDKQITLEQNDIPGAGNLLLGLTSSLSDMLGPFIWLSLALTVVLVVLYIVSFIRKRKLENAIFAMQKDIREMNERDRARTAAPAIQPHVRSEKETIIARSDEPQSTV